jgi:endonuclease/exonuclease/phosphatase family metal-dependent hydrolase
MRRFHRDDIRTYLDPKPAPYELDHVFVDAATYDDVVWCHPLNAATFHTLSDHAPVVVDIASTVSRTGAPPT